MPFSPRHLSKSSNQTAFEVNDNAHNDQQTKRSDNDNDSNETSFLDQDKYFRKPPPASLAYLQAMLSQQGMQLNTNNRSTRKY